MSEIIERIEAMPGWSPYKEKITTSGPLRVKTMSPIHKDLWGLWKNPVLQEQMKAAGYVIRSVGGQWIAFRWTSWIGKNAKERLLEESRASDASVELMRPPGLEYLNYQRSGIKYAIDRLHGQNGQVKRKGVLIGDDMGLGKTIQAIGVLNQDHNLHRIKALVICPASLKLNWRNEMRKWLIDGMGSNAAVVKNRWPDQLTNFYILNYDVLGKWEREIREIHWDYVIADEAHYMKNENARRTVFCMGGVIDGPKKPDSDERDKLIVTPIETEAWVFLTGTPMENGKGKELWTMINCCDPAGLGASRVKFAMRYAATDAHFEELQQIMRTKFMVRRMKADVLKELPPKIRSVISLDPKEWGVDAIFAEEMRIFKEYQEALKTWNIATELAKLGGADHYKEVIKSKKMKLGMTIGEIAKLRKNGAIAKVPGFMEPVMAAIREGKRPLIFAHHKEVMDRIQETLEHKKLRVGRIDGDVPPLKRQGIVDAFQNGDLDVFIGGIIPAGVGLTLTTSDTVFFAELDWIPGKLTQCEDRAHRIGQEDVVLVYHVVMEGSLDELMGKRLIEKQERIERALDSQAEPEELEEDEKEQPMLAMPGSRPSSKGYKVEALEADADKMSEDAFDAACAAIKMIADGARGFEVVDTEICKRIMERGVGRKEAALGRKIVMRNKMLMPKLAERMEFKPEKKVA